MTTLASRRCARSPRSRRSRPSLSRRGAGAQPVLGAPLPDRRGAVRRTSPRPTGIKINRIEAGDEQLVERLKNEGAKSPADVLLIVDAARLCAGAAARAVPAGEVDGARRAHSRDVCATRTATGSASRSRARVIVYNKAMVEAGRRRDLRSRWPIRRTRARSARARAAIRTTCRSSAREIAHLGEAKAEAWAKGVVANLARTPKGGDTDQIKAVAAGECGDRDRRTPTTTRACCARRKPEDQEIVAKTGDRLARPGGVRDARQHLRRRRAQERAAQGERDQASSSTSRATRRSSTSPTATTSGRRSRASR